MPSNPQDGEQYSGPLAGVPTVLEYDSITGGWKQVISTEQSVAILVSGTVEIEAGQFSFSVGSQYGEDTPHVSNATGTFIMGVRRDVLSGYVSADGDYAGLNLDREGRLYVNTSGTFANTEITTPQALANSWLTANPTVGTLGVFPGMFMLSSGNWQNVEGWSFTLPAVSGVDFFNLLGTQSVMLAEVDGAATNFDSLQIDPSKNLHVTLASGSFPADASVDTELADAVALTDGLFAAGITTAPAAALGYSYQYNLAVWDRLYGGDLSADAINAGAGGAELDNALNVRAALIAHRGNDTFDRLIGSKETGLNVNLISGSFPAEAFDVQIGAVEIKDGSNEVRTMVGAINDGLSAIPTGIYVGAFGMAYQYPLAVWDRLYGGDNSADNISGGAGGSQLDNSLNVRAIPYLHQGADVFDRWPGNGQLGALVNIVSGSFPSDSVAALADAMANPDNAVRVGAFNMAYNGVSWDRLYMGVSGSLAVDMVSQLDAVNDEVTAYVTGTVSVNAVGVTGSVDTELPAAAALSDSFANPTAPAVGAFGMYWEPTVAAAWQRMKGYYVNSNGRNSVPYTDIFPTLAVGALNQGFVSEAAEMENILSIDNALSVSMASGAFAADAALGQRAYDGSDWVPVYAGVSGSMLVDLATRLDRINDEVTAFVTGTVNALLSTGSIVGIAGQTRVVQRAVVNISGSGGEFELVAAVASQRIKVTSMMLIVDADTNIHFQSGWTGTAVTGPMSMPADGDGFFLNTPSTPDQHHFQTTPSENLVLDQSAPAAIGGWIQYYTEAG
jgi:hypothetical protein